MNPSIALSNPKEQCLTFFWNEMPDFYIGYRFMEGEPEIANQPAAGYEKHPTVKYTSPPTITAGMGSRSLYSSEKKGWEDAYLEQNPLLPVQISFWRSREGVANVSCSQNEGKQQLELVLQPFSFGISMWARLTTFQPIIGSYSLQQCLRFTGMFNGDWRKEIAHIPFLSEFDMQAMGNPNGTLTYARRDQKWFRFPVQHVVYPAITVYERPTDGQSEQVDHGLIVRETASRQLAPASYWERVAPNAAWEQMTCGMYWERTANISNRHPADCAHAWIDFGPLEAGQSRTLQGVVYYIEGSKDDLLALWQRDFLSPGQ
jgi:hypothetical protein